ncbi:MAG: glucosyltransferase domain-containing protein [Ruminococcus sp.]|nr:glucosyltransferase domain-containing protein [Ruminococcus sp.]
MRELNDIKEEQNTDVNEEKSSGLDSIIIGRIRNTDRRLVVVLIFVFLSGIIANGEALFNKYSFHDDVNAMFDVGATFTSGRWMLGVLQAVWQTVSGGCNYSLPLFSGAVSLLLLAACVYLIIVILGIKSRTACALTACLAAAYPSLTSLFGYMFTAPYYMISFLFSVIAAYFICKRKTLADFIFGVVFIALSMGTYQAFIGITLSLLMLDFFFFLNGESEEKVPAKIIRYFSAPVLGILLYFIINKTFLAAYDISMSDYLGLDKMGKEGAGVYFSRIWDVFANYLSVGGSMVSKLFALNLEYLYKCVLLVSAVTAVYYIAVRSKKDIKNGVLMLAVLAFLPFAVDCIFVASAPANVHSLMLFPQIMPFIFLARLLDGLDLKNRRITGAVSVCISALMMCTAVFFCRYDNIIWLKAELIKQRLNSYYTRLVTDIKSVEGYSDNLSVSFINPYQISDMTVRDIDELEFLRAVPYDSSIGASVNNYAFIKYIDYFCAFTPNYIDEEHFCDMDEVIEMPSYPDDGSIKIINGTVVVKF